MKSCPIRRDKKNKMIFINHLLDLIFIQQLNYKKLKIIENLKIKL